MMSRDPNMGNPQSFEKIFKKHLDKLNTSHESIRSLSLWILKYQSNYKDSVHLWLFHVLQETSAEKILAYIYLANDVIQNSKNKGNFNYCNEFQKILNRVFYEIKHKNLNSRVMSAIKRVVKVWTDRNIFHLENLNHWNQILSVEIKPETLIFQVEPDIEVPDEEDFVTLLLSIGSSASADGETRQLISSFPSKYSQLNVLSNISDKERIKLLKNVTEADKITENYNIKLSEELKDRELLCRQLRGMLAREKNKLLQRENQLSETLLKLKKAENLKDEIEKHLKLLPDMTDNSNLVPLPSATELFQ